MNDASSRKTPRDARTPVQSRKERLKAALKANMTRRKSQAKARSAESGPGETERDEG